jgi:hypothetical protein
MPAFCKARSRLSEVTMPGDIDPGEVIVTDALAVLVLSAWLVAVTVTIAGFGTVVGAVYKPSDEIVPTAALPLTVLFTDHVTVVFGVPVTVAVNCCVVVVCTVADVGDNVMVTDGGAAVIVVVALALFVLSATLVAVTVTVAGEGTEAGAVYKPPDVIVPNVALPPTTLFTAQVTVVFNVPVTVAVNCWVLLTCTLAEVGAICTATEEAASSYAPIS